MSLLQIGGFVPWSAGDYPGNLSAVIFCQGCSWRCQYCHNPHLMSRQSPSVVEWHDVLQLLERRRGLLNAVVFSGGEPTLQAGLYAALIRVRDMGFKTGLHTAGIYPERLRAVLPLLDWVGMDVKAPFERYADITGVANSGESVRASVKMLLESKVPYELRTTVHPALLSTEDMCLLGNQLVDMGADHYVWQECRLQGRAADLPAIPQHFWQQQYVDSVSKGFVHFSQRRA